MDRGVAKKAAEHFLDGTMPLYVGNLVILDEHTIETDRFWIFFYQHKRWVEGRDHKFRLSGNLPVVVDRSDESVRLLPRGGTTDERIRQLQN
jgi:hypothetical protein